jgi:hypothetical protein
MHVKVLHPHPSLAIALTSKLQKKLLALERVVTRLQDSPAMSTRSPSTDLIPDLSHDAVGPLHLILDVFGTARNQLCIFSRLRVSGHAESYKSSKSSLDVEAQRHQRLSSTYKLLLIWTTIS